MKTNFGTVPGIYQQSEKEHLRNYDQMLTQLGALDLQEDNICWEMGDLLVEIEEKFSRSQMMEAAEQVQVGKQVVKQRTRVARRFPAGHPLRKKLLKYSHVRVLSSLSDPDVEKWAAEVKKNQWTVAQLMKELEASGDQQAQQDGDPCIQCEQPLPPNGEIVSFTIGHQKRARCCGVECASEYFQELRQDAVEPVEPLAAAGPWPLQVVDSGVEGEEVASASSLSDLWQAAVEKTAPGDCYDLADLPPLAENIFN